MATPFRGALAALPMDAALAAPLIDSSPFQLSDCGMDTVCLADEAQRVAANLAIAASGFAATPGKQGMAGVLARRLCCGGVVAVWDAEQFEATCHAHPDLHYQVGRSSAWTLICILLFCAVRTTAVNIPQATASPASAASQGRAAATAGSPTEELRDLHVVMLTKQLADVQKKMKDLEGENLRLKEQVGGWVGGGFGPAHP